MSRPISRRRSNSGRLATAAVRRAMNCGLLKASAFCRPASARALWAFCLNWGEVARMRPLLADSLRIGERLGVRAVPFVDALTPALSPRERVTNEPRYL